MPDHLGWWIGGLALALLPHWEVRIGGGHVYTNELALLAVALVAVAQASRSSRWFCRDCFLALAPMTAWLLLHGRWPGPAAEGVKAALRASEFPAGLLLPMLLDGEAWLTAMRLALAAVISAALWGLVQVAAGPNALINWRICRDSYAGIQLASAGFGQHNQLGAYLVAGLALAVGALGVPRLRRWAQMALALGCVALLFTYSRAAWAGAAAVGVGSLLLFRSWRRTLFLLAAFAALALAVPLVRDKIPYMFALEDRRLLYAGLAPLILAHPWWGIGQPALDASVRRVAAGLPVCWIERHNLAQHCHNTYLEWGLAFGGPVFVGFWAALGGCGALALRLWRRAQVMPRRWLFLLAVAVAAFGAQASVDVLTQNARGLPETLSWGLMLAGARLALREGEGRA